MRGNVAAAVAACTASLLLQGCYPDGTCMWNADSMIQGCKRPSVFSGDFADCIAGCNECDLSECSRMKCAAYCAKQDGDPLCLANYQTLCENALEHVARVADCDVDCSAAAPSAAPGKLLLLALLGVSARVPGRQLLLGGALAAVMLLLSGCEHCEPPKPQLEWRPDAHTMNVRANRVGESGGFWTWRGTGFHLAAPGELEVEQYKCEQRDDGNVCTKWSAREANCGEIDFGYCECVQIADSGSYCHQWTCDMLEADQHVCYYQRSTDSNGNEKVSKHCEYNPMEMNEETYLKIKSEETKFRGQGNALVFAFIVSGEAWWFGHSDKICIVPGDFVGAMDYQRSQQRKYCDNNVFFREIETELSLCTCSTPAADKTHCAKWRCEEKDTGLFKVLFEAPVPMSQLVENLEAESYECKASKENVCIEWEADIRSEEEIEISRCKCDDDLCNTWKCDEYEVYVMYSWFWYPVAWILTCVFGCVPAAMFLPFALLQNGFVYYFLGFQCWLFLGLPPLLISSCVAIRWLQSCFGGSDSRSYYDSDDEGFVRKRGLNAAPEPPVVQPAAQAISHVQLVPQLAYSPQMMPAYGAHVLPAQPQQLVQMVHSPSGYAPMMHSPMADPAYAPMVHSPMADPAYGAYPGQGPMDPAYGAYPGQAHHVPDPSAGQFYG